MTHINRKELLRRSTYVAPSYRPGERLKAVYQAHTLYRRRFRAVRGAIGYFPALARVWVDPYWGG